MIFSESQGKSRRACCLVISPGSYDLALSNDTLHFALTLGAFRTMGLIVNSRREIFAAAIFTDESSLIDMQMIFPL